MARLVVDVDDLVAAQGNQRPSAPASIVCIGDSITHGATGLGYSVTRSWPVIVGEKLGVLVSEHGHLGASTRDYRSYPEWIAAKAALPHADVVVVGLGTNDADLEHARDEASVAQVVAPFEDLVADVSTITLDSPEIVVLSVPQFAMEEPVFRERFDEAEMAEINHGIELINISYRRMARRHSWHFIDYAWAINQHRDLFGNSIHPNQKGYEVIASILAPRLAGLLGV